MPTYDELVKRVILMETEIAALKRNSLDIRKKESRHREAAKMATIGHWDLDISKNILFWSDEIYRIFGVSPQSFGATYEAFLDCVHPQDRELVNNAYTASLRDKKGYDIVHRLLIKGGTVKYVHEKCKTEYDKNGNPIRSMGTVQDITELMHDTQGFWGIIGRDPVMLELFETIKDLSSIDAPVLIQGRSGTGKELVAKAIHNEGPRAKQPFVPVNCSALPDSLLESELFGHVRGAFTGALRDKKGRFELANGGTLFLDEVADLPRVLQAKLLRVLQEGEFERVGGEKSISVNVRVVSAANRDLNNEVLLGNFRDDLFYRLNVVPIQIPCLTERRNDIPLLVDHFLQRAAREGQHCKGMDKEALANLIEHSWPGNVRELQSAIQFALIKCKGGTIKSHHLPLTCMQKTTAARGYNSRPPEQCSPFNEYPVPTETEQEVAKKTEKLNLPAVQRALDHTGGNRLKAAKMLGVGRATLYRFLKKNPLP